MPEKDYSGTALWKKLGVKEGSRILVGATPTPLLPRLPKLPRGVQKNKPPRGDLDVILLFVTDRSRLTAGFGNLTRTLAPSGGLWIAWPKKASRIESDLSFETVQRVGLDAGLVDNKSCSIDEDWQALRFVYRLKDRQKR